jgi:hypothetical protein
MLDPRPISYIEEIQDDYPVLEYFPAHNKLTVKTADAAIGF